jgi:hypothetical protein
VAVACVDVLRLPVQHEQTLTSASQRGQAPPLLQWPHFDVLERTVSRVTTTTCTDDTSQDQLTSLEWTA